MNMPKTELKVIKPTPKKKGGGEGGGQQVPARLEKGFLCMRCVNMESIY